MTAPFRLAVFPDFREEGWPSMDLCADMLLAHLPAGVVGTVIRPPWQKLAARLPAVGGVGFNADRVWNRFVRYPRFARRHTQFDAFHVVDHSYAQLVSVLPAGRTGVYCYDIDAFRCLVEPSADPRPRWFRALARQSLAGLQRAAVVFTISAATAADLARFQLVDAERVRLVPLGVAPEFTPTTTSPVPEAVTQLGDAPVLLHVGSCIPRKRVDVLLDVVAAVRERVPAVRFVKVGGPFTPAQQEQITQLDLARSLTHLTGLSRTDLAAIYRRATVVLVPSEAEGFGLPVIEALACGAAVMASDLAVLREAGGSAAEYAPVGEVPAWVEKTVTRLTHHSEGDRAARLAWAANFTWTRHAEQVCAEYQRLAGR